MSNDTLLAAIDAEIRGLEEARKLLAGAAVSGTKADPAKKAARKRRRLGAEGRARIVEAQRNRSAARKAKRNGKA
jgi:hypothetical protein